MIYNIFIPIKPFSEILFIVSGGGVILEKTTPIRIDVFPSYNKGDQSEELGFVCSDAAL